MRALTTLLVSAIGLAGSAVAQEGSSQNWMDQFLAAYAQGTPQAFEQFCNEYRTRAGADPQRARAVCGGYLYRLRQRYGPVHLVMTEQRPSGPVSWLEGDVTHGVLGIRFVPTEDAPIQIDGAAIYQDVYPAGYPAPPPVAMSDAPLWLTEYFDGLGAQTGFSGSVLIAQGDEIIFSRAYGMAETETGRVNTTRTPFRIASVGKMMTAMAILNLARQRRVDLDAPIARYLPRYPRSVASQVTIRHLLTHTSGIELDDYEPFVSAVADATSLDDIIAAQTRYIEHLNEGRYQNFHPLGTFDYSNEEYDLLGAIVARVMRKPWDEAVRELVLQPAGAADVAFAPNSNVAAGYTLRIDETWGYELHNSTSMLSPMARPAGSQFATARALFNFMRYVERERRTNPLIATATSMQVDEGESFGVRLGYGLGFETEANACYSSYGHSGVTAGINAVARYYPQGDLTIIILANRDGIAADASRFVERSLLRCST